MHVPAPWCIRRRDAMTDAQLSPGPSKGVSRPDPAWLERIFRDHYAELCSFVFGYTASDEAAEDIVQDLFLSIWRDLDRWMEQESVRVLLFVAARNRALDYLRHRRVRERHAQRTVAEAVSGVIAPAADDAVVNQEIREALDEAIGTLPDRAREVFLLNREEGLTYREIAERLGISIKTVETQMSRSLKKLRARLAVFLSFLLALYLG